MSIFTVEYDVTIYPNTLYMALTFQNSYLQDYKFDNDRFMYPIKMGNQINDNMKKIGGNKEGCREETRFQDLGIVGGLILNSRYRDKTNEKLVDKYNDPESCKSIPEDLFAKLFDSMTKKVKSRRTEKVDRKSARGNSTQKRK